MPLLPVAFKALAWYQVPDGDRLCPGQDNGVPLAKADASDGPVRPVRRQEAPYPPAGETLPHIFIREGCGKNLFVWTASFSSSFIGFGIPDRPK